MSDATKIHFFQYDIPETRGRSVMANPSGELWLAGAARLTQSCWIIHEDSLERNRMRNLILRMTRAGVRWYTAPFDVSAGPALIGQALESIRSEIREKMDSARATEASETTRLARADAEGDRAEKEAALKRFRSRMAGVIRRCRQLMERVKVAADRFGITPEQVMMGDHQAGLAAIKTGYIQRAKAFADAYNFIVRTRGVKSAEAEGIRANQAHPGAVADFLDENGGNGAALREAYLYDF